MDKIEVVIWCRAYPRKAMRAVIAGVISGAVLVMGWQSSTAENRPRPVVVAKEVR